MAQWMRFKADVDFHHKSRAVTAYKAGMVEYLPRHIAESPQLAGKVEVADKPGKESDRELAEEYAKDRGIDPNDVMGSIRG